MDEINKKICLKIKDIRRSMKLSQDQFAELVNLSEDSIGKIERCVTSPKVQTLYQIARALNRPVADLLPDGKQTARVLSNEVADLVSYLRSRSGEDVRLVHDIAVRIFEKKK